MTKKILWIYNIKVFGLLGILTFHFWPQESKIVFHAGSLSILKLPIDNGFYGSFLFFIASGLGLTLSQNVRVSGLWSFLWSRFLRIYIPYWMTLITIILLVRVGYDVYSTAIPDSIALLSNLLLIQIDGVPKMQPHLWFLFCLIQMYFLFPLLYRLMYWSKNVGMMAVIVLFALRVLVPEVFPFSLFLWMVPFCFGMYIAFCMIADREKTEGTLDKLFPVGIVVLLIGTIAYYQPRYSDISFLLITPGLMISVYKIAKYDWHCGWINNIMYEIYLVHITILALINYYLSGYSAPARYLPFLLGSLLAGTVLKFLHGNLMETVLYEKST
jgi:peptidoglycan/LPS O-acetylase OafA/YrhL